MEKIFAGTRIIHIAAGSLALLTGLLAILMRRKPKLHRPVGRVYFYCMTIVFLTMLVMSLHKPNPFLLFIGIFTYHMCFTGYRAVKIRTGSYSTTDWMVEWTNIVTNFGLITYGIMNWINSGGQIAFVAVIFGSIGLRNSYLTIRRFRKGKLSKHGWQLAHVGGMVGSYIGAVTAFAVNNNKWMSLPTVVAWLTPTIALVPLIVYESARIKRKLNMPV